MTGERRDARTLSADAFWLPPDCPVSPRTEVRTVERAGRTLAIRWPVVTPAEIATICAWLRERQERVLRQRSVASIIDVLDAAAARWLDPKEPLRANALDAISVVAGFSPEMVAHAIDLEQVSSRRGDMELALDGELGDRRALDGFVPSAKGRRTAIGPNLIGGIFSANIPALPHLTVMRAFLVKAALLGRVSRGEPVYLPLYAQTLAELDPELASCLAVLWWDSSDRDTEGAFFDGIDHLIAYGGDTALGALRSRLPPRVGGTWHGHRMGFAWVGPDTPLEEPGALDRLAKALAYDFSVFDQHACLAPQACFVARGAAVTAQALAQRIDNHLQRWLEQLPPRTLGVGELASLRTAANELELDAAMGVDGAQRISPPARLQGAVWVSDRQALVPTPGERSVRVIQVADVDALVALLRPVSHWLQCAAVVGADDADRLRLARLGVTRLCAPGAMGTPSMAWRHDGRACLAELVRWCDEETVPPGETPEA